MMKQKMEAHLLWFHSEEVCNEAQDQGRLFGVIAPLPRLLIHAHGAGPQGIAAVVPGPQAVVHQVPNARLLQVVRGGHQSRQILQHSAAHFQCMA